jgi:hypothetical protein
MVLTSALASPVFGQTPPTNNLDHARSIAYIAAQKTESEVRSALNRATALAAANRDAASNALKEAAGILETDQTLSPARRSTLQRVVRDRLRVLESTAAADASATERSGNGPEPAPRPAAPKPEDSAKIKEGLQAVLRLRKEGKTVEAEKLASELAAKHPESVALQLIADRNVFSQATQAYDREKKNREAAIAAALTDVSRSSNPGLDDVSFPDDWRTRTGKRHDQTAPTAEERLLIKTLETAVDANFKNSRFQDVMDYLSTAGNRTIIIDPAAAAEVNLTYDSPVNFSARSPLALRTTLRSILAPFNLTFVVRDGVIHVTTPQKARDLMTTRVYYLGDLIFGGLYGGAPNIGTANDQIQIVQNVAALVEMITGAVDPLSWEKRGGQGHLGVNMATLSLTVRQSQEVHIMLRSSLYGKK